MIPIYVEIDLKNYFYSKRASFKKGDKNKSKKWSLLSFLEKDVKRREMQQLVTLETALMLKKIKRSEHKGEEWLLSLSARNMEVKKKPLKENNEPFGFMVIYCLVLVSLVLESLVIFSNAAKYFLKCNWNICFMFFKIIQLTTLWARYDKLLHRAISFAITQFTNSCKPKK